MVPRAGVEPAWPFSQRIFLPTTAFAAALRAFGVWNAPRPLRLLSRHRSPPSTLYTCRPDNLGRIGSALPRALGPGDSPTLTGSGQAVSAPAAQLLKSAASTNFATGASHRSLTVHGSC